MVKNFLVSFAVLGLTTAALANGNTFTTAAPVGGDDSGFYLGLQAGLGSAGWYRVDGDYSVSDDNSLTGRLYAGYDFTKNWALEMGYAYFGSTSKIKSSSTTVADIRTQIIDLVGVGTIPVVVDKFDIYAKAGAAYMMSSGLRKAVSDAVWFSADDKQHNLAAVLGIGVDYYFKSNLWMDVSWTTYMTGKKFGASQTDLYTKNYQPDANFYAIGIGYSFGN